MTKNSCKKIENLIQASISHTDLGTTLGLLSNKLLVKFFEGSLRF